MTKQDKFIVFMLFASVLQLCFITFTLLGIVPGAIPMWWSGVILGFVMFPLIIKD